MSKVTVPCDTCGTSLQKFPSLVNPHNFCSAPCYRIWRKTRTGPLSATWKGGSAANPHGRGGSATVICHRCGKAFAVVPSQVGTRKYCSRRCFGDSLKMQTGPGNPNWKGGKVTLICLQCGKHFTAIPAEATTRKFCSNSCRRQYPMGETSRAKIAQANTGNPGKPGSTNSMFRHGRSIPREIICPVCGQTFTGTAKRRFCSRACKFTVQGEQLRRFYLETPEGAALRARYAEEMIINGKPHWFHEEYAPGFTKALKKAILRRDGHRCRRCGTPVLPAMFGIHHIDGGKTDHSPSNLVTLCKSCHSIVHHQKIDASVYLP